MFYCKCLHLLNFTSITTDLFFAAWEQWICFTIIIVTWLCQTCSTIVIVTWLCQTCFTIIIVTWLCQTYFFVIIVTCWQTCLTFNIMTWVSDFTFICVRCVHQTCLIFISISRVYQTCFIFPSVTFSDITVWVGRGRLWLTRWVASDSPWNANSAACVRRSVLTAWTKQTVHLVSHLLAWVDGRVLRWHP